MQRKTITRIVLISLLALAFMVGCASASIDIASDMPLHYNNGSYLILPAGTYYEIDKTYNIWYVNGLIYPAQLVDNPTPTPVPITFMGSPITLTEIVLIVFFIVFIVLAFLTIGNPANPFLFTVAAFVSVILGIDLALIYINNNSSWIFGILGFALVLLGFFLLIAGIQFNINGKRRK
jgi:hypothetical protein